MEYFEAVVIGSGFGGAVAACRLSQAKFPVLLLERGRRYERNDFPALPEDGRLAPDLRRWVWSRDQGLWDLEDLGEIVAVQAAGYGGGSLLYANVHLRPPERMFDEHWPAKFRGNRLEEYFDLAAFMLDAAPVTGPFVKTQVLEDAAERLRRTALRPPIAVSRVAGPNEFGVEQGACDGCGKCCTGCPSGSKNTLDHNYLAVAEQNGCVVRTQCEVKRIVQNRDAGEATWRWRVSYVNHLTASYVTVAAKYVFLCAGVVNSTRLLRHAKLRPECRPVQERVGLGYFPNADAVGMIYGAKDVTNPSSGPCITTGVVHWDASPEARQNRQRFFMIQDGGYAPELSRLLGVLRGPLWIGRNRVHGGPAPYQKRKPSPPAPRPGIALVSPLDGLLDAARTDNLTRIGPKLIQEAWDGFLKEVERPLLMPAIVASTIERSAGARYKRLPAWLKTLVGADGLVMRALKGAFKFFIWLVDGNVAVGHGAMRAILGFSDLSREDYVRDVFGYDDHDANRRMMLLAMGEDAAPGALVFDKRRGMLADLDLYHLIPGYTNQELLMKDIARELGGELRLNPAWSFLGKPITVHSQGGCAMSEQAPHGVTNPSGEVKGCPGLYVMDGSILCRSVGVNPTPTILAIAECNMLEFIRSVRGERWSEGDTPGEQQYRAHRHGGVIWNEKAIDRGWNIRPVDPGTRVELASEPLGVSFCERFHGYCAPIRPEQDPIRLRAAKADAAHRLLEIQGRPAYPFSLFLTVRCPDLNRFFEDMCHRLELEGHIEFHLPGAPHSDVRTEVRGYLELLVPRHKLYGIAPHLHESQKEATNFDYRTRKGYPDNKRPRFMYYHLTVGDNDALRLEGYKRIRNDPGLDAWRDTTALFTRVGRPHIVPGERPELGDPIDALAAGVLHVNLTDFLYEEVRSFTTICGEEKLPRPPDLKVTGTNDPARILWATAKFISFFFGTLQRVYSPAVLNGLDALLRPMPNGVRYERPTLRM